MKTAPMLTAILALLISPVLEAKDASRPIPRPLPSHPGNIFLAGETINIAVPPGAGETWRALDYEGKTVAEGRLEAGQAKLGQLPTGYYEVVRGSNRVSVGVLEPLRAPTPKSSPICIDVAMAWFFPKEGMAAPANLCALAGINRTRDRLSWPELEPKRGEFAANTRYDWSAQTQSAAGLLVLQTAHRSPSWANPDNKRFPLDLRDIYNFYRQMARRWDGQVMAYEPWNEADVAMFGGHTGSEMATLQKAAYLGLKAGNPKVIACMNVFALHRQPILSDFRDNEAWPYFDTFNLHHYEPLNKYPALYADFRAVSAGKPLWVSECSVHVRWTGDPQLKELSAPDLRLQSERVTKTYALGLHQGAEAIFYFMLPHYSEGDVQYGVLRPDLTPRPAFLALAAAGRLLADARRLGRIEVGDKDGNGYLFSAKPDGKPAQVLVVWSQREASFELPKPPKACFDHLGRACAFTDKTIKVGPAPLYIVLARGTRLPLLAPPESAKLLPGKPGSIVLQAILPDQDLILDKSAYRIRPGQTNAAPVFVYNFGAKKVHGALRVTAPPRWTAEFAREVEIAPGERKELTLNLAPAESSSASPSAPQGKDEVLTLRINGDFGAAGQPVLCLRLTPTAK